MALRPWGGDSPFPIGDGIDVRDWAVHTLIDNTRAGSVHDVLIDEQGSPRYLDVALDAIARHVLVPIGQARADPVHSLIWLPGFAANQFELIPSYGHGPISRGDEARLVNAYSATMSGAMPRRGYRVLSSHQTRRPASTDPKRLVPLARHPDLRVASGEADPRRWSVVDRDGIVRGMVCDLLVDRAAMKVRYLICELAADDDVNRCVLVPVEFLRLDAGVAAAMLPTFSADLLIGLPAYTNAPPDREAEANILERFAEAQEAEDFYRHPRFNAEAFFGAG